MLKWIKEYRFYCSLAVLVFIPILSLNSSSKAAGDFNFLDRIIVFVTAPVQALVSFSVDRTARFIQSYVFLINTEKELKTLVEENRKLISSIHNFREMEAENKRLRSLLQFQDSVEGKKVTAQVIARDVTTEFQSVRLNKGSAAGLENGMPVVTHEGIVGRVLRTTNDYADVITILDNLSAIDAIVQRSRARGILEGASDFSCLLKYALRTDDIEAGDMIVSSGLDGIYPKGDRKSTRLNSSH